MILVTGGTGMVGSHLLYRFRESEIPINAIYRTEDSINKTRAVFDSYRKGDAAMVNDINWIQADLLDIPSMEDAMEGISQVYHCAAALGDLSFEEITNINVTGTQRIIDIAIAMKVKKFCYVSSIATLGNPIGSNPITEEDFFNPDALNTDYALTKYGGEMEVWRASQEGLKVVIVNPGVILGEGNYKEGSGRIFSKTYQSQPFYTSGSTGVVDVADVVEIMELLMNSEIYNERYIIVAENLSFKPLLTNVARALGKNPPQFKVRKWMLYGFYALVKIPMILGVTEGISRAQINTLTSDSNYDNTKIKKALGYKFRTVSKTIDRISLNYLKNLN
ncbi:NAD-dependent epimerase/dehydratase family protein [Nonlabens antarcticus]|uniref:NAD-dependent epimerase/dehydratase family protein n=1 Tax=Nonlabens antarcticus TaxID=392714 RepID=UPI0018911B61|nr:NAD-dependent epimerase/dehydratase family protein [Nonlabens antarcticus]